MHLEVRLSLPAEYVHLVLVQAFVRAELELGGAVLGDNSKMNAPVTCFLLLISIASLFLTTLPFPIFIFIQLQNLFTLKKKVVI